MTSKTKTETYPRIAIIGGGPGGLTLLLTLHRRGIPATLYDRDETPFAREHLGGMLDLGWDSGQLALRENGLQETFDANSRAEAQATKILDRDGNVLVDIPADPNRTRESSRPEIDRSVLRKILLDAVPVESVKWDHALVRVSALGDGAHELTFANGKMVVCDVLVGADGGRSRVRPLVSPATPAYSGINGAEISFAPEDAAREDMRDVVDAVGNGTAWAWHEGKSFGVQRNGDGRLRTYLYARESLEWTLPVDDPAEARRVLLEMYEGWAPWMRKLIAHCDGRAIYLRPMFWLAPGHRWGHVPGVTLIGDAAHLSPPAGQGANLAMLEGYQLGVLLAEAIKAGQSAEEREAAVAAWEETMLEKSGKLAGEAIKQMTAAFETKDDQAFVDQLKEFMANPEARRES